MPATTTQVPLPLVFVQDVQFVVHVQVAMPDVVQLIRLTCVTSQCGVHNIVYSGLPPEVAASWPLTRSSKSNES